MAITFDTKTSKQDALDYHSSGRKGKIEVVPTKPCATARELSLAYSPGVAEPSLEIAADQELSYKYTTRGNLVAVISNGTAVLGLGDIGAYASKPVMEGKGVLFKKFADIDVFDIEVDAKDIDGFCKVVKALEPTFGAVNLEDVKSPECFVIERRLRSEMAIPVFHDDQHGTAIITGAALINALELVGKKITEVKVVFVGAGAAAVACAEQYVKLGVPRGNLWMCDKYGLVHRGRKEDMDEWKDVFAQGSQPRTLAEVARGADVMVGLSARGVISKEMVASMASNPILFALANPVPEILPEEVMEVRSDVIMATGRSDYPNQVNNVLGFPGIFRGALDVRAKAINDEMKLAASHALAALARQDVPESVSAAYGGQAFHFGRDYIIPKPFDPRVLTAVAPAVAKAAVESGVARIALEHETYVDSLRRRQGRTYEVMTVIVSRARRRLTRIAFPEGNHPRILRAAQQLAEERICEPVLLGKREEILELANEAHLAGIADQEIIDPLSSDKFDSYAKKFYELRQRSGVSWAEAVYRVRQRNTFAAMMLKEGLVDGLVTGLTRTYPEAIRPSLEIVRTQEGRRASGTYIVAFKESLKLFADCTVNADPSAEELADIAISTAELARAFELTPRIAMLSYSNFGTDRSGSPLKVRRAVEMVRARRPDLEVEGEMQVDPAVVRSVREAEFPFARLGGDANVLIFPDLNSGNIGYKLLWRLGGAEVIGPVLMGMVKPVNVLQQGASVQDVVNLAAMTAVRAQGELTY
ncbi:MAG: NADP-dependent malic enzyme [Deltaproteobacteria bacterium]|nr:MAG: NADP-dependent malic enzyme [Deltaproteobacteria bacterium]